MIREREKKRNPTGPCSWAGNPRWDRGCVRQMRRHPLGIRVTQTPKLVKRVPPEKLPPRTRDCGGRGPGRHRLPRRQKLCRRDGRPQV